LAKTVDPDEEVGDGVEMRVGLAVVGGCVIGFMLEGLAVVGGCVIGLNVTGLRVVGGSVTGLELGFDFGLAEEVCGS
jgi:hypothetical protein